ncbi:MAG: helix-turn-helix domain-containing protein [Planctomycetes bacterium]|nr:helix-turn-helix domain-containing protein [Planctomycetota bacterium]
MPNSNKVEAEIRVRLAEVAQRYSQAEIARRLNLRRSTVSRYMRSNRIPAAFVADIAREFGVNTSWLVLGEGTPWIADVRSDQATMGRGLIELVQAMGRISKLRLGALAGRQDAKNLRELSETLEVYERLREKLASQSRATYDKVLADWTAAMDNHEQAAATRLRQAAEQISRLCPDAAMQIRHEKLHARHEYAWGSPEESLRHILRAFVSALPATGEMNEETFQSAISIIATLDRLGRSADAARYARVAEILAPNAQKWPSWHSFNGLYGWVLVGLDDIGHGLPRITQAMSATPAGSLRDNLKVSAAYALYISGALELSAAAADPDASFTVIRRLLLLTPWCMDPDQVRALWRRDERMSRRDYSPPKEKIAEAHIAALEGRHAAALKTWREAERFEAQDGTLRGLPDFPGPVMRTQLLRLAGDTRGARKALEEAEEMRVASAALMQQDYNWRRIHWRNAAMLTAPESELGRRAREFAQYARQRGLVAYTAT